MDVPFDAGRWQPTRPLKSGDSTLSPDELEKLSQDLADHTKHIVHHPYDPELWICRAETLRKLRYPELALGDAHKASLLCRQHLQRLEDDAAGRWRLGNGMGFWISETRPVDCGLRQRLLMLQEKARKAEQRNLCASKIDGKGKFNPRPYPWLISHRSRRSDELVARINQELTANADNFFCCEPFCEVKHHAFGDTGTMSKDILGVFATCDIPKQTTVLVDKSRIWGCNGPGSTGDLTNLHGGSGCGDPLHPNLPEEDYDLDLRWIRDDTGKDASTVLVMCRLLLAAIQDGVSNPLDHSLIARLTPTYRSDAPPQSFYLHTDIDIPFRALQQFGIDIFADQNFDTWILFTIYARAMNNFCGDVLSEVLMPLFSLFNHSCDPNLEWIRPRGGSAESSDASDNDHDDEPREESRWLNQQASEEGVDHATIVVTTVRDIKKGEQLFVEYDAFVHDDNVWERRERLKKWLVDDCACERCVREEKETERSASSKKSTPERKDSGSEGAVSTSAWNDVAKVEFPEDSEMPEEWKLNHW